MFRQPSAQNILPRTIYIIYNMVLCLWNLSQVGNIVDDFFGEVPLTRTATTVTSLTSSLPSFADASMRLFFQWVMLVGPRASDSEDLRWRNVRRYGIYHILKLTPVIRIMVMSTGSSLLSYKNYNQSLALRHLVLRECPMKKNGRLLILTLVSSSLLVDMAILVQNANIGIPIKLSWLTFWL